MSTQDHYRLTHHPNASIAKVGVEALQESMEFEFE